ncbi:serpin family protein [Actinokineospora bangkokensis]|uniref:Serpin domain-containing protein n=1 Tax=Actinokineospora bangkokensis TaxID=1193682 RepID=A0A1Q9LTT9_9PSEU|nr:serpin family protein [Actinokineospora bangkokensis]OLR95419.1 hypothetical protein BJP25_06635 [Actinokineospora bangkokensis]
MGHLDYTLALHAALAPDPAEQVCWSPFSVASALGLVTAGAAGPTRDELVRLLGDPEQLLADLDSASDLTERGSGDDPPVIAVANTLWVDAAVGVHEDFAARLSGGVRGAPFKAEPDKARQDINADVAETTRGLIPELLAPGAITAKTMSALVNALYLKCAWEHSFTGGTDDQPFHAPGGDVTVPTMHLSEHLEYKALRGWRVVHLPAEGGVEAVVLLPDDDLADAEARLTPDLLDQLLTEPRQAQVDLSLPKLSLRTQAELSTAVHSLGVETVFGDEADLSGISPDPLAVEDILHEAVLRVDEDGFEGAAATAVLMRLTSILDAKKVRVVVDRPFLFLVRHRETGAVYFLARVTDPSLGESDDGRGVSG